MPSNLAVLKQPVAIRSDCVCSHPTALRVRQHCLSWSLGDFTVTDTSSAEHSATPKTLFTVDGKIASWTQRRAVREASGLPIYDMRRKNVGATWYVELPGGSEPLVTLAPRRNNLKDKLDVYVHGEEETMLEVRGLDVWKKKDRCLPWRSPGDGSEAGKLVLCVRSILQGQSMGYSRGSRNGRFLGELKYSSTLSACSQ